MENLPTNAVRQSYLFVQKGHGARYEYKRVLKTFDVVRHMILQPQTGDFARIVASNHTLAETQARLATENSVSQSQHVPLFTHWGENVLQSEYDEIKSTDEEIEEAQKGMKTPFRKWCKSRVRDIKQLVELGIEGPDDIAMHINAVETSLGMELFLLSNTIEAFEELNDYFGNFTQPMMTMIKEHCKEAKADKLLTGKTARANWVSQICGMISRLTWVYGSMIPDLPHCTYVAASMSASPVQCNTRKGGTSGVVRRATSFHTWGS
jgi:hypothetical protein